MTDPLTLAVIGVGVGGGFVFGSINAFKSHWAKHVTLQNASPLCMQLCTMHSDSTCLHFNQIVRPAAAIRLAIPSFDGMVIVLWQCDDEGRRVAARPWACFIVQNHDNSSVVVGSNQAGAQLTLTATMNGTPVSAPIVAGPWEDWLRTTQRQAFPKSGLRDWTPITNDGLFIKVGSSGNCLKDKEHPAPIMVPLKPDYWDRDRWCILPAGSDQPDPCLFPLGQGQPPATVRIRNKRTGMFLSVNHKRRPVTSDDAHFLWELAPYGDGVYSLKDLQAGLYFSALSRSHAYVDRQSVQGSWEQIRICA